MPSATRTDTRAVLDAAMTERELLDAVVELARLKGFLCYDSWSSLHSEPGFPGLTMVRGRRLIFAELKREKGRETAAQKEWLARLRDTATSEVFVWRPSQWSSGEIAWVLA